MRHPPGEVCKPVPNLLFRLAGMLAALVCATLLAGCGQPEPVQQEAYVFGTRVEIVAREDDRKAAREALNEVLREFDRMHRSFHAWQPSELTALNGSLAAGQPALVGPELAGYLREAQTLAARGRHLFDPGIGGLIDAWGFHADEFTPHRPDPALLARFRQERPSLADLSFTARPDGQQGALVRSRNALVAVDFGGYLKGVALDRAADILRAKGIRHALINIGGNVLALGDKHGQPWTVGIQHPRAPGPLAVLSLHDGEAIGTSGDYQRFFEMDGQRYAHIMDPRTAEPVHHTQAITVVITPGPMLPAGVGTLSDMASKPAFVAGNGPFAPGDADSRSGWRQAAAALGVDQVLRVDADGHIQVTRALASRLKWTDPKTSYEIID